MAGETDTLSAPDEEATAKQDGRTTSSYDDQVRQVFNNKSFTNEAKQQIDDSINPDDTGTVLKTNNNSIQAVREATKVQPQPIGGNYFSVHFMGSLELGWFNSVNDVYLKYSIIAGPDWLMGSGYDVGITQIARYRVDDAGARRFVWNQPITITYRAYNFYGWPQMVISVFHFDTFGNDQILGYGCVHLPVTNDSLAQQYQIVKIYSPQPTSWVRQVVCWLTGRKPELIDSNLFARADCRSVLQMSFVGEIKLAINLTTKDVRSNGYRNSSSTERT